MKDVVKSLQDNLYSSISLTNEDLGYIDSTTTASVVFYPDDYVDYYRWMYYPTVTGWITVDETKQAFTIVKMLMNKKLVKVTTVKQFIELVEEIVKIL